MRGKKQRLEVARLLNVPFLKDVRKGDGVTIALPDQNFVSLPALIRGEVIVETPLNFDDLEVIDEMENQGWQYFPSETAWGFCAPDDNGRWLECNT
jgi:hypothetical protein